MKRFVILGLPRSGTTYLMSLLDAHRDITCAGEQFNPYAVIGVDEQDDTPAAILARDSDPVGHMIAFFERTAQSGAACGGFKYMIGHNLQILKALEADPDLYIIYVWRENRLAQVSSLIKAAESKKWAQNRVDSHVAQKIEANPRQISHRWHEYATFDYLVTGWLAALPNPKVTYEYREMFLAGFEKEVCQFLGVRLPWRLKSPLVKQGSNAIADRFEKVGSIRNYFTKVGHADWLDEEL
ncbi:MAG: sulfotransferase [Sulfitobacter sp.]